MCLLQFFQELEQWKQRVEENAVMLSQQAEELERYQAELEKSKEKGKERTAAAVARKMEARSYYEKLNFLRCINMYQHVWTWSNNIQNLALQCPKMSILNRCYNSFRRFSRLKRS